MTDWNDPVSRLALVESVGPDEYNRLFDQHVKDSTVAVVKGRGIRPVGSRFGTLFMVIGTDSAYSTLEQAKEQAAKLPCALADDWRDWPEDKRNDRQFMVCPACGEMGSHVQPWDGDPRSRNG